MHLRHPALLLIGLSGIAFYACSSNSDNGSSNQTNGGSSGASGNSSSAGSSTGGSTAGGSSGGESTSGGTGNDGGSTTTAGTAGEGGASGSGGSETGGAGGGEAGGTGGEAGGAGGDTAGGGGGGFGGNGAGIGEDIPPWRDLNITVQPGQHTHNTPSGQSAGMDNRAAKMEGKLVIDMGVGGGGYQSYLGKRGFHVIGITDVNSCDGIDDWSKGRDFDGDCRLNTLDGMPHGDQNSVTPEQSIMHQVWNALTTFEQQYPGEGWGYFLTQDGQAVRWSDVAFTGFSHGAQSAICFATELRLYRAVAQSGPRDNTCGNGPANGQAYDPNNPPWDPNCPIEHIASWIDAPLATPIDRLYGFTGGNDGQFGDIMYTMFRMNFVGDYVNLADPTQTPPYNGTHRFYSLSAGHNGFPDGFPIDAINIAFGVSPENQNPNF